MCTIYPWHDGRLFTNLQVGSFKTQFFSLRCVESEAIRVTDCFKTRQIPHQKDPVWKIVTNAKAKHNNILHKKTTHNINYNIIVIALYPSTSCSYRIYSAPRTGSERNLLRIWSMCRQTQMGGNGLKYNSWAPLSEHASMLKQKVPDTHLHPPQQAVWALKAT